jgi:polysaccharide export outer membrane protein
MMIRRLYTPIVALALGLAGCQGAPKSPAYADNVTPSVFPGYRLQAGDLLELHFRSNPELNEQEAIGPDGRISFLYAPLLPAAGHTVDELQQQVIAAYAKQLAKPAVTVALRSSVGTQVFVTGEVTAPGEVIVPGQLSALEAVTKVGGFKVSAQEDDVILLRRDANNRPKAYAVNLRSAMLGQDPENDVVLQSDDIIYVPKDKIADVTLVFQRLHDVIPYSFGLAYNLNPVTTVKAP